MNFKCFDCKIVMNAEPPGTGMVPLCPECKEPMEEMCSEDHNHCSHPISSGVAWCEKCGEPVCPVCNCHDVAQISRVTGYLQEVSGWNIGKRQELKDRQRYTL